MLGLYGDNGKEHGNYYVIKRVYFRGYVGGYTGIMEKKMETII